MDSIITYYDNGNIQHERYKNDKNQHHKLDKPAIIFYNVNGNKEWEHWVINGKNHREDGPATIYYDNGNIISEYWCDNGKLHRLDGPAVIYYDYYGNIKSEHWYINGKELSYNEWLVRSRKRKLQSI